MLTPFTIRDMPVVTLDMIQAYHGRSNEFLVWMNGQTSSFINGVNVYYYHDYTRWAKNLPVID